MSESRTVGQTAATLGEGPWEFGHVLIFTGHMIDQADRQQARFPAWAEGRAPTLMLPAPSERKEGASV